MKKFLNFNLLVGALFIALSFTACQKERDFPYEPRENSESIVANSNTALLIERTVSNDGSFDNIVDGSSCFNIRFPYTVEANGLEVTINSFEDLQLIEEIFDAFEDNEDILEILFPITITLADYTEVVINNKDDLREIAKDCIEGGGDDDIECIDFVYPVKLFTFDVNLETTGDVTVHSDFELRRFFAGLDETDIISIEFPVNLKLYDGSSITVNSNAELAAAIEAAKEACDEDDDDDYNDDDFTKERLDNLLVECPWLIHEFERDNQNQIDQYFEYLMNFTEDGAVRVVDREGNSITGTWSTRVSSNHRILLKMEFDILVDFTLEWHVYEIHEGKIKIYGGEGNKIIMENICDVDTDPNTLRDVLKECVWVIKKVKVDDVEIRRLLGYEFQFMAEGVVTLSNGDVTSNGTWEITTNAQGRLVMAITMGQEPGVSFAWPLTDLRDDRLKFEIPGTDYELILQRVCNDNANDGDVAEIRNILMGGDWMLAKFIDDGEDYTSNYSDFDYNFGVDHKFTVSIDQDPQAVGIWRVLRNSDQKIKVYLNLGGEDEPFGALTDDWDFVSITSDRIELKDISGDGTVSILVFEK